MMRKIVIADNSERDANRVRSIVDKAGLIAEVCLSGSALASYLELGADDVVGVLILWELPGPPFGSELLIRSRRRFPDVPVVIVSNALDASIAARASKLGAYDLLEKPLDLERVGSCLRSLLNTRDPLSSLVEELKTRFVGDSLTLLTTLKQLANAVKHDAERVLLIGESGTGKELVARSFHELGPHADQPYVAVNIAAIPSDLIESMLFGHEKGAFTGAAEDHVGFLEESGEGTLFLDELGDLKRSLQVKLLRAIEEKKFRRLKGVREIDFQARLVCATNIDLAHAAKQGKFRKDLFHRISQKTIYIPPLRDRDGDIDLLSEYFLQKYRGKRPLRFARETRTVLRSYSYPTGNVRELENYVKAAVMECDDDLILPKHLPLLTIETFLPSETSAQSNEPENKPDAPLTNEIPKAYQQLVSEVVTALPPYWRDSPYREALDLYDRAFDRVYLPQLINKYSHNLTQAAKAAGIDKKTFAKRWQDAGLPPLRRKGEPK